MKKYLLTGGISALLVLSACGNDEPTEEEVAQSEEEVSSEEVTTTEEPTEEVTEEMEQSDQGTRSNPYTTGDMAEVTILDYDDDFNEMAGKANISFDNVLRGEEALNEINDGPGTIEAPEDGMEWMTFDFTFELAEYVDADTKYTFATNFPTYTEDGEQFVGTTTAVGEQAGNSVYEGGSVTSRQALTVPEGEKVLIGFSDAEEDVLFEIK